MVLREGQRLDPESQLKPDDLLRTSEGHWETRFKDIVIRTTHEHPFFVKDKGWTPLGEIKPGDEIRGEDGWVLVKNVDHTGVWGKVYNLRVADHHTYFVGKPEWGFAVWAHNTYESFLERLGLNPELVKGDAILNPKLRAAYDYATSPGASLEGLTNLLREHGIKLARGGTPVGERRAAALAEGRRDLAQVIFLHGGDSAVSCCAPRTLHTSRIK